MHNFDALLDRLRQRRRLPALAAHLEHVGRESEKLVIGLRTEAHGQHRFVERVSHLPTLAVQLRHHHVSTGARR